MIGRWRIVETNTWERDYLDLVEPAMMVIGADGHGDMRFLKYLAIFKMLRRGRRPF